MATGSKFDHAGGEDFFELVDLGRELDEDGGLGVAGREALVVDARAREERVGGGGDAGVQGKDADAGVDGAEAFFEVGGFVRVGFGRGGRWGWG